VPLADFVYNRTNYAGCWSTRRAVPTATMATTHAHPQERTARQLLTQEPLFLGIDGQGTAHYWDGYEQAVALVEDDESARLPLADTPFQSLSAWCEYVRTERGWQEEPRVGGSIVDDLVIAVGKIE